MFPFIHHCDTPLMWGERVWLAVVVKGQFSAARFFQTNLETGLQTWICVTVHFNITAEKKGK